MRASLARSVVLWFIGSTLVCLVLQYWAYKGWEWGPDRIVEFIGFVTGVLGVGLTANRHILNFPIGIVNVLSYAVLFIAFAQHYANGILQIIYFCFLVYGWMNWRKAKDEPFVVQRLNPKWWFPILVGVVAFTALQVPFLVNYIQGYSPETTKWIAIGDAFTFSVCIAAQILSNTKRIETWYLWAFVDFLYIPFYIWREYHVTAALMLLYLALCITGYKNWKESLIEPSTSAA